VLAYVALGDGVVVSADQLAEALWADEPPGSAMKTLQGISPGYGPRCLPERRAVLLFKALELFRGDPLRDVPSEFLHSGFGLALTERRPVALEDWTDIRIYGGHSDVLSILRSAVNEHPYRERLWELLITAQAARGLRTRRRCRSTSTGRLATMASFDPDKPRAWVEETIKLCQHIFQRGVVS
jgi:hypothetical protein